MKYLALVVFSCLAMLSVNETVFAQEEVNPTAIYEIRYWQDMSSMGNNEVYIDTMIYHGNERAAFKYTNSQCVSYHCRNTDSLIYSLLPRITDEEYEIVMGEYYIRTAGKVTVPFRARNRDIYKVYVSDIYNKTSGIGDYSLVSPEFGVIYRWNADSEFFQLINIDVTQRERVLEEIQLLPLMEKIYATNVFRL